MEIGDAVLREQADEVQAAQGVFALRWGEDGASDAFRMKLVRIYEGALSGGRTCNHYRMSGVGRSTGQRRGYPLRGYSRMRPLRECHLWREVVGRLPRFNRGHA